MTMKLGRVFGTHHKHPTNGIEKLVKAPKIVGRKMRPDVHAAFIVIANKVNHLSLSIRDNLHY